MRHLDVNHSPDLGIERFHFIKSSDIRLALDDGVQDCRPLHPILYHHLARLIPEEPLQYHRQLFYWQIFPKLWYFAQGIPAIFHAKHAKPPTAPNN